MKEDPTTTNRPGLQRGLAPRDLGIASAALTPEALREYKRIWQHKNPGRTISDSEARVQARRVLAATHIALQPITANMARLLKQD